MNGWRAMWPDGVARPSKQLEDVLRGIVQMKDAPEAIQSWARLSIYQGAVAVLAIEGKGNRRNAIAMVPAPIRPYLEAEILRIHRNK